MMKVTAPIEMKVQPDAVLFTESWHERGFRMEERVDPFHKILYVLEGSVTLRMPEGGEYTSGRGGVFVLPAGVWHTLHDVRPATLFLLGLGVDFVRKEAGPSALWQKFSCSTFSPSINKPAGHALLLGHVEQHRVEACWRRAIAEGMGQKIGWSAACVALAVEVLLVLGRMPTFLMTSSAEERVRAVQREVEESFTEAWTLDDAAARAGLSRRRFTALHRHLTGETFLQRLTRLRMRHAARLLEQGECSVLGAMWACGYEDLSHFYRVFRQHHGVPPGSWQRIEISPQ